MKFLNSRLLLCLYFLSYFQVNAQNKHPLLVPCNERLGFKHFITKTPWRVQLAWTMIDDDGKPFNDLLNIKNTWNFPPYPTKIAIEKECTRHWNLELALAYNNYKSGKTINGDVIAASKSAFSVDVNGKYLLTKKYRIEPYLLIGLGYTHRTTDKYQSVATLNAGIGFTSWIVDNKWGIILQGSGKFGLKAPIIKTGSNYLQHSIGVVYKFTGNGKRLKLARAHLKKLF